MSKKKVKCKREQGKRINHMGGAPEEFACDAFKPNYIRCYCVNCSTPKEEPK